MPGVFYVYSSVLFSTNSGIDGAYDADFNPLLCQLSYPARLFFLRARISVLMKQAPIERVRLQKRKFCACLKYVSLLQMNLTSMSADYWVAQWQA